jgi:hypothetical protein
VTRRRWPLVVVAISVACVGTLVLVAERSRVSVAPVDAELARLGAAGFPTTWEEALGATPTTAAEGEERPASNDGFADIHAAFVWLESNFGGIYTWEIVGPWSRENEEAFADEATPEQWAALGLRIAEWKPFYDRVDAGLAKPQFRVRPENDRWGLPTRSFGFDSTKLLQFLVARAIGASTEEERLAGVSAAARLSVGAARGAVGATYLSLRARETAIREARRAAELGTIRAAHLHRALDADLAGSVLPLVAADARTEPACLAAAWRAANTSPTYPRPNWRERLVGRVARVLPDSRDRSVDEPQLDEMTGDEIAAVMRFWGDAAAIDVTTPASFRAAVKARVARGSGDGGCSARALRQLADRTLRVEAASRLARVALAAKAHRETTGDWPATLGALAPALGGSVPTDPRTDAPFVYSTDGPKVRLVAPGDLSVEDPPLRDDLLLWEFPK